MAATPRHYAAALLLLLAAPLASGAGPDGAGDRSAATRQQPLRDEAERSTHSIVVGGRTLSYVAEAGVQVVNGRDPLDEPPAGADGPDASGSPAAQATLSYVAYFLGADADPHRPITFLFNGGPGSATIWLHLGSFGPKRVVTQDAVPTPPAQYRLVDNAYTLLPDSDLVFVDAPGTGFGLLRGEDREHAFFGVDPDARAFATFIVDFLSRHDRWNSPKYLFGESYGTVRAAVLANLLQSEYGVDLNGVMMLGQTLSYEVYSDWPQYNPGSNLTYALGLPTFAATAWYHHRLPAAPARLEPLLAEVEDFALGEYLTALAAGSRLAPERRAAIVARLHAYTGLAPDFIERANLRIASDVFEKHVLGELRTTGRVDARFAGPAIDALSRAAEYDPLAAAITSAYVSVFNDYVRAELHFGAGRSYKSGIDVERSWNFEHQPPGATFRVPQTLNAMPDLAAAMKKNPTLRVQVHGGYYDLATPYFQAVYEQRQLPVPPAIAANVEIRLYASGHMIYVHEPALGELAANVRDFIRRTHGGAAGR